MYYKFEFVYKVKVVYLNKIVLRFFLEKLFLIYFLNMYFVVVFVLINL